MTTNSEIRLQVLITYINYYRQMSIIIIIIIIIIIDGFQFSRTRIGCKSYIKWYQDSHRT